MIIFNELRITKPISDVKYLHIDVSVMDLYNSAHTVNYSENIYIKDIYVVKASDFTENGDPSEVALYSKTYTEASATKNAVLDIASGELTGTDITTELYFVYVSHYGNPTGECDIPCALNKVYDLGVVFDLCTLYSKLYSYTSELLSSCEVPQDFIDIWLHYQAYKSAVETCNYTDAIAYYNILNNISNSNTSTYKSCNCHS